MSDQNRPLSLEGKGGRGMQSQGRIELKYHKLSIQKWLYELAHLILSFHRKIKNLPLFLCSFDSVGSRIHGLLLQKQQQNPNRVHCPSGLQAPKWWNLQFAHVLTLALCHGGRCRRQSGLALSKMVRWVKFGMTAFFTHSPQHNFPGCLDVCLSTQGPPPPESSLQHFCEEKHRPPSGTLRGLVEGRE